MSEAHARLAPSAAHRWGPGGCPASPRFEAAFPEEEDSPESKEGTAAHWYAFEVLAGRPPALGVFAPNGHAVTVEIMAETQGYIDAITEDMPVVAFPGVVAVLESRVNCTNVHPTDNWGTPDAYFLNRNIKFLRVRDFKFGHRYVDEFDNWQLINYAVAILESHGIADYNDWTFELIVHQPRYYGPQGQVRVGKLTGMQLYHKSLLLREAALATDDPDAPCSTGEHCRDCAARHACPVLQEVGYLSVDLSKTTQPVNLSPGALGRELTLISQAEARLKARRTGLEAQATGLIQNGKTVIGWSLGRSGARTKWAKSVSEVIATGELLGLDLSAPQDVITPAQAKKAGFPLDLYDSMTTTPLGSVKLEPFDERTIAKKLSN